MANHKKHTDGTLFQIGCQSVVKFLAQTDHMVSGIYANLNESQVSFSKLGGVNIQNLSTKTPSGNVNIEDMVVKFCYFGSGAASISVVGCKCSSAARFSFQDGDILVRGSTFSRADVSSRSGKLSICKVKGNTMEASDKLLLRSIDAPIQIKDVIAQNAFLKTENVNIVFNSFSIGNQLDVINTNGVIKGSLGFIGRFVTRSYKGKVIINEGTRYPLDLDFRVIHRERIV